MHTDSSTTDTTMTQTHNETDTKDTAPDTTGSWKWVHGEDGTNMRGENAVEAYKTAFAETFGPMIREYLYGRGVDFDRYENEFQRQLAHRGFTRVNAEGTTNNRE